MGRKAVERGGLEDGVERTGRIGSGWDGDDDDKDEDVQTKVNYKRERHRTHIERGRMEHGVQNR